MLLEASEADLIVSFDLLGNDLINGMINDQDFDTAGMTPLDELLVSIDRFIDRVAATNAHVFLANLPEPSALPFFKIKQIKLRADGLTDGAIRTFERIETYTQAANARMIDRAALYANVYIVDIARYVSDWLNSGILIGDELLWVTPYGGLVGLDGLHFTDTAYALLTNVFIREMSDQLNLDIPLIEITEVRARDRERTEQLIIEGFDPSFCEGYRSNLVE